MSLCNWTHNDILYQKLAVLDHGFVSVMDYMGNDGAVVQAARISYGEGTKKLNDDAGLLQYLMRHHHTTPFEMAEIKFHLKMPIFVARQWIRHRTASVNEQSARYSILESDFYLPRMEVLAQQSKKNNQGREEQGIDQQLAQKINDIISSLSNDLYITYLTFLAEDDLEMRDADPEHACYHEDIAKRLHELEDAQRRGEFKGIARELARMVLSLNVYTQWYFKQDLHNLLNFVRLRMDSHAQYEIRVYAEVIWEIVKLWVPLVAAAFENCVLNGARLTGNQLSILRDCFKVAEGSLLGNPDAHWLSWKNALPNMSRREFDELIAVLNQPA